MLTSWSEQSTPAELSMASLNTRPPPRANSMRPRWVTPRFPPSPTTLQRRSQPSARMLSLALSPTAECGSSAALIYVPMPPFQSKSTGAFKMPAINSSGVRCSPSIPRTALIGSVISIDFEERGNTPPPSEISDAS